MNAQKNAETSNGHHAVAAALAANDIDTVFTLVGDHNIFIVHALVNQHGVRNVSAAHESAVTAMADGYARRSGRLGVAMVTHGPGLTNTLTTLTEAVRNRTPLVLITGDTPTWPNAETPVQTVPIREIVSALGAGYEVVKSVTQLYRIIARAIGRAIRESRPIVLDIPADILQSQVSGVPVAWAAVPSQRTLPDPAVMDEAVGLIAFARRPIVLAGRGALSPQCRASVLKLAERIGAPVATSLLAKDLFEGEPGNLGVFGTFSNEVAVDTIISSDCIIAFGAGLNLFTTQFGKFLEGKRIVQCDNDASRLGGFNNIAVSIVGDAAQVADQIVASLDEAEVASSQFCNQDMVQRIAATRALAGDVARPDKVQDMKGLSDWLDRILPTERSLVFDAGRFLNEPVRRLHVPYPQALIWTCNFGSIGLATGTAVGVGIAHPSSPVIAVVGDGGFMMGGMGEFNAAVRHRVDLIVIVFNDGSYGAEHTHLRRHGLDFAVSLFDWPSLAALADALGGRGVQLATVDDFDVVERAIATRDRPLLIDVKLDPDLIEELVQA